MLLQLEIVKLEAQGKHKTVFLVKTDQLENPQSACAVYVFLVKMGRVRFLYNYIIRTW